MRRRKKNNNDPYRYVDGMNVDGKTAFARTTNIQALSPTFQSLSDSAIRTLDICKLCRQYHTGTDKDGNSRTIDGDLLKFYFNRELYGRYGLRNPNKVRKSLIELVEKGFIDVCEIGWTTKTKNVYRFDWKWQELDKGREIELSPTAKAFIQGRKKKDK